MIKLKEPSTQQVYETLDQEFEWFAQVLEYLFQQYFNPQTELELPAPPDYQEDNSTYAQLIKKHNFGISERLVLCLALAPHLKSESLDLFFTTNPQLNRPFTEFGGYSGKDHSGFLPTGETAAFLCSKGRLQDRINSWELFSPDHIFAQENILHLERNNPKEPFLSGRLLIQEEFLFQLTTGKHYLPDSSTVFPAKKISTTMEWEDLVVSSFVMDEIEQIKTWIEHEERLMNDPVFRKHVKPGFRSLFYGPPGTGKTMTASLLGKACGMDVYRIDLSLIVSKYIGETEKNLEKIFRYAEKQNWILFFDEADALFGKRTQTSSSNDRFANQEVAYLLQRVEDFPGIIILASNLKSNMDEAFSRRFQSTIYFPIPDKAQRLRLWQNIFKGKIKAAADVDFQQLANDYELSGGSMINILRDSTLMTIKANKTEVPKAFIINSIRKEFQKYGKTL